MRSSRRTFMRGLAAAGATALIDGLLPGAALAAPARGTGRPAAARAAAGDRLIVATQGFICHVNLRTREYERIAVNFPAHSFVQHPTRKDILYAFEKWGDSAVELDLSRNRVTGFLEKPDEYKFFGHGAVVARANLLFTAMVDRATGEGRLLGYDLGSGKMSPVNDFAATPGELHELQLLGDGLLMVASTGLLGKRGTQPLKGPQVENSALYFIDPRSGLLLKKAAVEDKDQILAHFAVAPDGTIVAISGQRPDGKDAGGAIYVMRKGESSLRRVPLPAELAGAIQGEILSVAIDAGRSLASVTNPNGKLVIFVDLNEAAYVAHSAFQANGAVFDPATRKFVYNVLEPLDAIAEADVGTAAPGVISLKGPQPARPLRLAMGAHMALLKV